MWLFLLVFIIIHPAYFHDTLSYLEFIGGLICKGARKNASQMI
jgi:hypothetical protein